jgi:hypothetical protein
LPASPDQRTAWEVMFAEACRREVLDDPAGALTQMRGDLAQASPFVDLLSMELEETMEGSANYCERFQPRLWRLTGRKSLEACEAAFFANADNERRYEPLALLLRCLTGLRRLHCLWPLTRWAALVLKRASHKLTREAAGETSVDQFIGSQAPGEQARLRAWFDAFSEAWNEMRPHCTVFECKTLDMPPMSAHSPLALCTVERGGSGLYLYCALAQLADVQNRFLRGVLRCASAGAPALAYLLLPPPLATDAHEASTSGEDEPTAEDVPQAEVETELAAMESQSVFPSVPILGVRHVDVVDAGEELVELASEACTCELDYGCGRRLIYDWDFLQTQAMHALVRSARDIDTSDLPEKFAFDRELFVAQAEILEDVAAIVPQIALPDDKQAQVRVDQQLQRYAGSVLQTLTLLLCCVKRVGGAPTEPLAAFSEEWLANAGGAAGAVFSGGALHGLQLRHAVALYEALEDRLIVQQGLGGPNSWGSLWDCYRVPLQPEERRTLQVRARGDSEALLVGLRRFIFRYLASGLAPIEWPAEHPLYYVPTSVWPRGSRFREASDSTQDVLGDLLRAHLHDVVTCLAELQSEVQKPASIKRTPKRQTAYARKRADRM